MLNVFFSVDVEIWCEDWDRIDAQFPDTFQRYVYGNTAQGAFGLPFTLQLLNQHGLHGVFFVESLFASHFGVKPLAEIVELIQAANQEVQLHLHPEWINESLQPILPITGERQPNLRHFTLQEQTRLIAHGKQLLEQAGATNLSAFRAGNFSFNLDTLAAVAANGLLYDSSYDPGKGDGCYGLSTLSPVQEYGVYEYPMSVFTDGFGTLRHAQLTACSYSELECLLWRALEQGQNNFMILSHNFEFLNPARNRADPMVIKRFRKLCEFLDRNRDSFKTVGFNDLQPVELNLTPSPLSVPMRSTALRVVQQGWRRQYRYPL